MFCDNAITDDKKMKEDCDLLATFVGGRSRAVAMIESCGGPGRLVRMSPCDMMMCLETSDNPAARKVDSHTCQAVADMVELVRRSFWKTSFGNLPECIENAGDAEKWFRSVLRLGSDRECFWVLPLDATHSPICKPIVVAQGLLNGVPADAREVFVEAIRVQASAVIVCHNHPSGDCTPSKKDIALTKGLIDASNILRIPLLDHIVISDSGYVSIREEGKVRFYKNERKKKRR